MDNEVNELVEDVVDVLNQKDCSINELIKINELKDQRIAELEEQLKNAIVPKFKSRDIAFRINRFTKDIERVVIVNTHIEIICGIRTTYTIAVLGENKNIEDIDVRNIIEDFGLYISQEWEEDLFTTKEEAQAKLKELRGE